MKKVSIMQQDSKIVNAYVLGVVSLVLALFVPFGVLVLRVFQPLVAALILGAGIPLIAIIVGGFGFVKSFKHSSKMAKAAKILSLTAVIMGVILFVLNLYIFIKSATLA